MIPLEEMIAFLDQELPPDHPADASVNGIQVANKGQIDRVYVAVDASLETFQLAEYPDNALFIVHHGLFWKKQSIRIVGPLYQKIVFLLSHNASLYASHLPLDNHLTHGNNAMILRYLGLSPNNFQVFGSYHGFYIGLWSEFEQETSLESLLDRLHEKVFHNIQYQKNHSRPIKRVAVVTGDGCDFTSEAALLKADLFITGEFSHQSYTFSQEAGMNMLYLSHYGSEKWGVISFGELLTKTFGIEHRFIEACPKTSYL